MGYRVTLQEVRDAVGEVCGMAWEEIVQSRGNPGLGLFFWVARRLTGRTLREIGEFAGIEPLLLQSAFDDMAPDVLHPTVTLNWQTAPLRARCTACQDEFPIERFSFVCTQCAGRDVQILSGEQLILVSVGLLPE